MPAITATATAVMVLTNVGLQFFNNWRSANTSEEMRKKQQEFQEAAQQSNHERMMQLLREGQALQEEMETQMHEERIKNINEDFDNLIKRVFHSAALGKWPLNVLPMVMKNQSLGSYRSNSNENIALHVIFTPSNCQNFNASVFPQIEQGLEVFMNRHWNTLSAHPILFYSGAWKTQTAPTYNEIAQLQADLPHLPVLLITPFFKPDDGKLVFNIHMWGMGQSQDVVIQPTEQEFSYYNIYAPNMNYGEEITSTTIEEFVPYLQCMIGYLADTYFWITNGSAPILPSLLSMGNINTDGMKYLWGESRDYYEKLISVSTEQIKVDPFKQENILNLYEGVSVLWDAQTKATILNKFILDYIDSRVGRKITSIDELHEIDCKMLDSSTIDRFIRLNSNTITENQLYHLKELISRLPLDIKIRKVQSITLKEIINKSCESIPDTAKQWHLCVDVEKYIYIIVAFFTNGDDVVYSQSSDIIVYLTQHFILPRNLKLDNGIDATIAQLKEMSLIMRNQKIS